MTFELIFIMIFLLPYGVQKYLNRVTILKTCLLGENVLLDKLELYYDYYKETCSLNKAAQSRRNKYYVILCCLEALSFLFLLNPETALEILMKEMNKWFKMVFLVENDVLHTLLWIMIAYVMIRYCQDTLYIERLYVQISSIEKEISNLLAGDPFNREGEGYLKDYPIVLNIIDLFYKLFSPILFLSINVFHIIKEWKLMDTLTLALVCDTTIFGVIFIIIWFYFFEIHSKITSWCKQHVPFVEKVSKWLKKLLKEV